MNPFLKFILRLSALFLLIFVIVQPYNWFCKLTENCKIIEFSNYIPRSEGTNNVTFNFQTLNRDKNIKFFANQNELRTVANRRNIVKFTIKNNGKRFIEFSPRMIIEPQSAAKYIKRSQCLCFKKYKLKSGESKILEMEFMVSKKIDKEQLKENGLLAKPIIIRFEF